jgi:multiple sugar transport system permease protein
MATVETAFAPQATSPREKHSRFLKWLPTAWFWMLIPAVFYLGVITLWPMIDSIYVSLTDMGTNGSGTWVGLNNYLRGLGDGVYWHSLGVTSIFMVFSVAIETVAAWIIALLLWAPASRLTNWARTLFAIPMMMCPVVVGITWRSLLNPQFGWINALLNMPGMDWLGNANALWMLVAVDAWQWTPFLFLIISGGLLSLPGEVMEAARVDGAGPVRRFWSVVLPLMMPVTLVGVLLRSLDASKTFDLVYNLTTGGPGNATETAAMFIYRRAFQDFDQGYAAALSVITAVLLTIFAGLMLRVIAKVESPA